MKQFLMCIGFVTILAGVLFLFSTPKVILNSEQDQEVVLEWPETTLIAKVRGKENRVIPLQIVSDAMLKIGVLDNGIKKPIAEVYVQSYSFGFCAIVELGKMDVSVSQTFWCW